jgi:hypothetical protein
VRTQRARPRHQHRAPRHIRPDRLPSNGTRARRLTNTPPRAPPARPLQPHPPAPRTDASSAGRRAPPADPPSAPTPRLLQPDDGPAPTPTPAPGSRHDPRRPPTTARCSRTTTAPHARVPERLHQPTCPPDPRAPTQTGWRASSNRQQRHHAAHRHLPPPSDPVPSGSPASSATSRPTPHDPHSPVDLHHHGPCAARRKRPTTPSTSPPSRIPAGTTTGHTSASAPVPTSPPAHRTGSPTRPPHRRTPRPTACSQ